MGSDNISVLTDTEEKRRGGRMGRGRY
jgi:hypothetical protein